MKTLTPHTRMQRTGLLAALALLLMSPRLRADDTVPASFARSYTLEARGKYAHALAALRRVSASQENSYIYQLRLGWLTYLTRKHTVAIQAYNKAARLAPQAVEPLQGLLLPQMAARRWKDAQKTADRVLAMAPGNYLATTRKAWILFNLGRFREAEKIYVKVLRQYPANLTMRAGLGWARARQGRLAGATKAFRAVLRYSPKNNSAAAGLAWIRKQGK